MLCICTARPSSGWASHKCSPGLTVRVSRHRPLEAALGKGTHLPSGGGGPCTRGCSHCSANKAAVGEDTSTLAFVCSARRLREVGCYWCQRDSWDKHEQHASFKLPQGVPREPCSWPHQNEEANEKPVDDAFQLCAQLAKLRSRRHSRMTRVEAS